MTDQPASPPALTESVVNLGSHLAAEQKLWSALVRFARELSPWDWVLVGGQMVALHGYIAGTVPPRTSEDIDIVANVLVRRNSLEACASAAEHINLRPKPPVHGRRLQRFEGDGVKLDLLVPDHLPSKLHPMSSDGVVRCLHSMNSSPSMSPSSSRMKPTTSLPGSV